MGDPDAQYALGCHLRVENDYVQTDQQAFYYLEKAVDQLHPGALYLLGVVYLTGDCVKKDIASALWCFHKASEKIQVNEIWLNFMSDSSSSSGSSDAEVRGSNNVRSASPSVVRSLEDVEGLATLIEQEVSGKRANAKATAEVGGNVETEARAGPSEHGEAEAMASDHDGIEESEAGLDTDVAAEHKRLARKREFDPVVTPRYEWVHGKVGANYSRFRDEASVLNLLAYTKFLDGFYAEDRYPIGICRCRGDESPNPDFIFLDKSKLPTPSFYVYDCWFRDLQVKLSFDDFILSVLQVLNVAPTQLHPNSWAAMQAFKPGYDSKEGYSFREGESEAKAKWISLNRILKRYLLESFTSSYKNFKNGFFRIGIREESRKYFYDEVGQPLFPLAWTRNPRHCDGYKEEHLIEVEREGLKPTKVRIPKRCRGLLLRTRSLPRLRRERKKGCGGREAFGRGWRSYAPFGPPQKRLKQTTIPEHSSTPSDVLLEVLVGPGFLNPKVTSQEFISLDFMTAKARRVVEDMSSADKLKALGELFLRYGALTQVLATEPSPELSALRLKMCESKKVTREVLTRNNELIEENKKAVAENANLRRQLGELKGMNKKLAEEREKAVT
ncbi:hypothetical protein Fmac_033065 [Flemingia macrophylla]|uniref:Uncharacterized protein n=1 Tax=Flemingia macrophylla TaxID=520843 RepID=A0ABD1L6Q6_9FABA